MADFSTLTLSLPLHTVITLGFYGIAALYIIFTIIMYFHWNEYSIDKGVTKITLILYLVTTLPLLVILGITALII